MTKAVETNEPILTESEIRERMDALKAERARLKAALTTPSPAGGDGMTLLELVERCEKATGPDREIDTTIFFDVLAQYGRGNPKVPRFTASLDAAKTLAPEGLTILVEQLHEGWRTSLWSDDVTPVSDVVAATEALSRCAAALSAQARKDTTKD